MKYERIKRFLEWEQSQWRLHIPIGLFCSAIELIFLKKTIICLSPGVPRPQFHTTPSDKDAPFATTPSGLSINPKVGEQTVIINWWQVIILEDKNDGSTSFMTLHNIIHWHLSMQRGAAGFACSSLAC